MNIKSFFYWNVWNVKILLIDYDFTMGTQIIRIGHKLKLNKNINVENSNTWYSPIHNSIDTYTKEIT